MDAALERAKAVQHAHTHAYARYYASVLHALRGEWSIAKAHAEECLALSEQHGFRQWLGLSRAILATGFMGGLTTYSAFNGQTLAFIREGAWGVGLINVAATLGGCMAAGVLGLALGLGRAGGQSFKPARPCRNVLERD